MSSPLGDRTAAAKRRLEKYSDADLRSTIAVLSETFMAEAWPDQADMLLRMREEQERRKSR
ncbi:MAG: hypothetical protein HOQ19_04590 [Gemmatimonadaceae bacterium]|nr:hypothetical protein [Gemmatimonadaceae bacterium]NUP69700.1 hypothetical protein [Gemmatimonadaceae bacterium]NUR34578.1 hypothetical protein [Gemmatimonadaceae bacterium]